MAPELFKCIFHQYIKNIFPDPPFIVSGQRKFAVMAIESGIDRDSAERFTPDGYRGTFAKVFTVDL